MVVLRVAVEDDLEVIQGIELSVYPTAWTMNFFRLMLGLSGELFLVVLDDGEVIGYTVGEVNKMGTVADPKIVGHVLNVAVTEEHQGGGVGTLLMDELELWDDTMLIVCTDHGFLLSEHDWWGKNRMPLYNEIAHDIHDGVRKDYTLDFHHHSPITSVHYSRLEG